MNITLHGIMRMKRDIAKSRHKRGSLSVEAALVMPIFLFAMICTLSLLALSLFQIRLKEAMHEEIKHCVLESIDGNILSTDIMGSEILEMVGEDILKIAPINGGIEFYNDKENGEIISISAMYEAALYYDFFDLFKYRFTQKCLQHDFKGYRNGIWAAGNEDSEERYVYVTENSEVYHLNRECTHIRLKITEMSGEGVINARNSNGGKYKSCEHCHSKISDGRLYITPEGDKYHNSLSCSGLKRSVYAVPLSEVKDKRCCQRCGG